MAESKFKNLIKRKPLYSVWCGFRYRCDNPNVPQYKDYGGRGISYSEEWASYENFERDMLPSYKKGLQIDRADNDGNYCKQNCRWVTPRENSNNRRNNRIVKFRGLGMTLNEWARKLGVKRSTLG